MEDDAWAKAIIIHLTGKPQDPSSMLLKMINDIRSEGYVAGMGRARQPGTEAANV